MQAITESVQVQRQENKKTCYFKSYSQQYIQNNYNYNYISIHTNRSGFTQL